MRLKIFRAASSAQAMAQIRQELGPEALILATRRAGGGVEITAALEPAADEPQAPEPSTTVCRAALAWHGIPAALIAVLEAQPLEAALAQHFGFGPLPLARNELPLLVAGPLGAGKTLTVARLAARLVMAGQAPLVISTDARRAGATEQLAAFTRLLRLNLVVAATPVALGRALARRADGEPVLIDTAGTNPFAPSESDEFTALAATAEGSIALVLPAGLDATESADLARGFARLGATRLVATRLDTARRLGAIPAAAHAARLTLTEAGIGPGVADGLAPLTPSLLARRLQTIPGDIP